MTLEIGLLLHNRYRIHTIIAHGGMGSIYQALDENLGVEVAVKENLDTKPEFSRQFHREATILASLRHPNLPRVTDHFVIEGEGQYLVMDYIDGEDLRHRMSRTLGIKETEALLIGIAICNALDYLHSRQPPILHRDIKPGNIKITPRGQIYLVDFGLAKIVHSGQATTIGAQSLTPGYAPPEQYGQGTDSRSDIYSLAATLYAALTNALPEDGLARAMGSANLTPLRQRAPQVSDRVAIVIERGMAINPDARYQTVNEFKLALLGANTQVRQKVEGVEEIIVEPASPSRPMEPSPLNINPTVRPPSSESGSRPPVYAEQAPGKPGWLLPAAGLLVLLALVGAAGFLILPGILHPQIPAPSLTPTMPAATQTPPSGSPVIAYRTTPSATMEAAAILPSITPAPVQPLLPSSTATPEPEGTPFGGGAGQIAFASNRSGAFQIYVMDPDGKNLRQVTELPDGACQPDWSPDGKRLVFVSPCRKDQDQYKGSALFLVNVDGTGVIPLRTTPGGDFEPAWSPDGAQIAFTTLRDGRSHIYLYTLADQSVTNISKASALDRQPAWSPDGKAIAFSSLRRDHYQIFIMDRDGKNFREFSNLAGGQAQYPAWAPDGQIIVFSHNGTLPWLVAKRLDDRINEFPISEGIRPALDPAFSPDGSWIVFMSNKDGNPELYRMTPNGIGLTRLTEDPGIDIDPEWKPR